MTRKEQSAFIRQLCRSIEKTVTENVKREPQTEAWDGHELRMLLLEHFRSAADISVIAREPKTSRAREYRNMITTTNVF